MGAGPGILGTGDLYWFVETITARNLIEATLAEQNAQSGAAPAP